MSKFVKGAAISANLHQTGVWGCVEDWTHQREARVPEWSDRTQWSTEEDGCHWLCEFGDVGNDTSCVKQFNLDHRKWEDYRSTRFYNEDSAESALVMKRWLNRVEEDSSGLTLQEWTPDVDTSRTPNHGQFYLKIIETVKPDLLGISSLFCRVTQCI